MKRIDSAYKNKREWQYELPVIQKENHTHYRLILNKRCSLSRCNHTNRLPINAYSSTKPLEYLSLN